MKKLIFSLLALAVLFASCSNSSDGSAGIGLAGGIIAGGGATGGTNTETQTGGGSPTNPSSGETPVPAETPDPSAVLINASNLVYIGEGTETVDATEYKVKKYADVLVDNPYFYTYYKVYYLNGKVRRVYRFEHGIGHAMDYKYDEFVEHYCSPSDESSPIIFKYYENGKVEEYICYKNGKEYIKNHYTYSNNLNLKDMVEYINGVINNFTTYYESGKKKQSEMYNNGVKTFTYVYYEDGTQKSSFTYSPTTGYLSNEFHYYTNGKTKLFVSYDTNTRNLLYFTYNFDSGYTKYFWNGVDSSLYTYADGKTTTTSTDPSVYTSKEDYTPTQAAALLEQLKNN